MPQEFNNSAYTQQDKKIRLLCVITQSEMGGAQQFLAQLVSRLDKTRFSVSVIAGNDGRNELKTNLPIDTSYIVLPSLRRNPSFLFLNDWRAVFGLRRTIICTQPDVVLLLSSKAGFIGSLASRIVWPHHRPTIIYRIGGWAFNDPLPGALRRFYRTLEWLSARWKDYIITNSASDVRDARRYNIKPRKELLTIYNGIDPYISLLDRETARAKIFDAIGKPNLERDDLFLVGSIANFYPAKGLEYLIQAAAKCPERFVFVIIGDGAKRHRLERLIESLGLTKRVHLAGKLANAAQYLPAFDAFALSSVKEGFPWVILEAIAAKVPVVTTRVGGIPEIIENEKSGIVVEPRDPEALAQAIIRIADDVRLRQNITIQAHQKLLTQFDVRQMVDRFQQLFTKASLARRR